MTLDKELGGAVKRRRGEELVTCVRDAWEYSCGFTSDSAGKRWGGRQWETVRFMFTPTSLWVTLYDSLLLLSKSLWCWELSLHQRRITVRLLKAEAQNERKVFNWVFCVNAYLLILYTHTVAHYTSRFGICVATFYGSISCVNGEGQWV